MLQSPRINLQNCNFIICNRLVSSWAFHQTCDVQRFPSYISLNSIKQLYIQFHKKPFIEFSAYQKQPREASWALLVIRYNMIYCFFPKPETSLNRNNLCDRNRTEPHIISLNGKPLFNQFQGEGNIIEVTWSWGSLRGDGFQK